MLRTGLVGTVVTAICCFTPLLGWILVPLGLGTVLGWLDFVLLPLLAFFVVITGYALWRKKG